MTMNMNILCPWMLWRIRRRLVVMWVAVSHAWFVAWRGRRHPARPVLFTHNVASIVKGLHSRYGRLPLSIPVDKSASKDTFQGICQAYSNTGMMYISSLADLMVYLVHSQSATLILENLLLCFLLLWLLLLFLFLKTQKSAARPIRLVIKPTFGNAISHRAILRAWKILHHQHHYQMHWYINSRPD